jgi:glycine hydroxymethyltransferase
LNESRCFAESGLRIGTPSITSRGMREEHMAPIVEWIDRVLQVTDDTGSLPEPRQLMFGVAPRSSAGR